MEIITKKSARAKRIQIRIHKGQVIIIYPNNGCINKALEFFNSKKSIITQRLANQHKISFEDGSIITILGKSYTVIHLGNLPGGIILNDDKMIIYGGRTNLEHRVKNFLTFILKQKITELVLTTTKKINVTFNKISIKETYTRWGSCSSRGNLSFCLKLIFMEEKILEYVVVHEVCHLKEMNHSKEFWELVESLYPDWKNAKIHLKKVLNYF